MKDLDFPQLSCFISEKMWTSLQWKTNTVWTRWMMLFQWRWLSLWPATIFFLVQFIFHAYVFDNLHFAAAMKCVFW